MVGGAYPYSSTLCYCSWPLKRYSPVRGGADKVGQEVGRDERSELGISLGDGLQLIAPPHPTVAPHPILHRVPTRHTALSTDQCLRSLSFPASISRIIGCIHLRLAGHILLDIPAKWPSAVRNKGGLKEAEISN